MRALPQRLTCLMITALSFGCERVEFEVDPISLSTELLNQRRYSEAIDLLTNMQSTSPELQQDSRVRILLASALAGSVGVDAIELFDILGERFFKDPLIESISFEELANRPPESAAPESVATIAQDSGKPANGRTSEILQRSLIEASKIVYEALDVLFRLPYTSKSERPRLNRAMSELRTVPSDDMRFRSARLYLALLDIVQFSNHVRDVFNEGIDERDFNGNFLKQWACKLRPAEALPSVYGLSFYLEEAFRSLETAGIATVSQGFKSLQRAIPALSDFNRWYLSNNSTMELIILGHQAAKESYCDDL